MRKLVYEIYNTEGKKQNEVSTYEEMMNYKNKGFIIKDKMVNIKEKTVYEIFNGEEKIGECTTFKDRAQARKYGFTVKQKTRVY